MSALAWMNPAVLMGVGAVLIPLALHWHRQRQRRRIAWAAMHLLAVVEQRHKRQYRVQDWLLLCLRMLLIGLLVLMVARPHLPPDSQSTLHGVLSAREHVVVLDDSASMMATPGSQSRWAHGVNQVENFIKQLAQTYPQDRLSVFRSGNMREPVMESVSVTDERWYPILHRLRQLSLPPLGGDWFRTVTQLRKRLKQLGTVTPAVYIVSDGLQADWEGDSQGEAALSLLASMKEDATVSDVSFIHVDQGRATNFRLAMPSVVHARRDSRFTVSGRIINESSRPTEEGLLSVNIGDDLPRQRVVPVLMPGESHEVSVSFTVDTEGEHIIQWYLPSDGMALDNQFRQVCHVRDSYRALIVASHHDDQDHRSHSDFFLGRALNPVLKGQGTVTQIDRFTEIPQHDLDGYDVVVVVMDPFFNLGSLLAVKQWVSRGGVLVVVPEHTLKGSSQALMASMIAMHDTSPELSARHAKAQMAISVRSSDPSARLMAGMGKGLFKSATWNPLWQAADVPAGWKDVLYHTSDQSPAALAVDSGKGRVFWLMGATHAESGNWVLHPSFMLWCQSVLDASVQQQLGTRQLSPGQTHRVVLNPQRYALDVSLEVALADNGSPQSSARSHFKKTLQASITNDAMATVDLKVPHSVGSMTLTRRRQDGDLVPLRFVINPDPSEMNLRPITDGVRLALDDMGITYAQADWPVSQREQFSAASLWRYLWVMCLVLLLIEQGYAAWSRLRRSRPMRKGVVV